MFDFLLTTPHCATRLHKLMPHILFKTTNSCDFSFFSIGTFRLIDTFSFNKHLFGPTKISILTLFESRSLLPIRENKHKTQKLPSTNKSFLLLCLFLHIEGIFSTSLNS